MVWDRFQVFRMVYDIRNAVPISVPIWEDGLCTDPLYRGMFFVAPNTFFFFVNISDMHNICTINRFQTPSAETLDFLPLKQAQETH